MPTLLERAKDVEIERTRRVYTNEELELVKGWLKGEVTLAQVDKVMKLSGNSACYVFLALGSRILANQGRLAIKL